MKKIVFLFISIITAFTFASCSEDSSTPATAKYVTINLQIGGDSTLNLSGGSTPFTYSNNDKEFVSGKTLLSTRATVDGVNVPDFVPEVPTKFTAYLIAHETKNGYSTNQFVDSVSVHTGSNYITVPAMKYKVYVSNYKNPRLETNTWSWENWYSGYYSNPMGEGMPYSSTTLYLYGDSTLDFTKGAVGEIKMTNPYAAVCIYKNEYVISTPYDYNNSNLKCGIISKWYYLYINCAKFNKTNLYILLGNFPGHPQSQNFTFVEPVTANNIYQYVFEP
jgi:hypothetical protein